MTALHGLTVKFNLHIRAHSHKPLQLCMKPLLANVTLDASAIDAWGNVTANFALLPVFILWLHVQFIAFRRHVADWARQRFGLMTV